MTDENSFQNHEANAKEEETILEFLDSMDSYLTLFQSLSSTLRQGWLDLASARHSMGPSRINSSLFDLKLHSAATTLQVDIPYVESESGDPMAKQPRFTLFKWTLSHDRKCDCVQAEFDEEDHKKSYGSELRHRVPSNFTGVQEKESKSHDEPLTVDDQVQKERLKSVSIFGTLVSPKLRAAQSSFEKALETLINIANVRSSMLSAYAEIRPGREGPERHLI